MVNCFFNGFFSGFRGEGGVSSKNGCLFSSFGCGLLYCNSGMLFLGIYLCFLKRNRCLMLFSECFESKCDLLVFFL